MGKKFIACLIIAVSFVMAVSSPITTSMVSAKSDNVSQIMKSVGIMKTDQGYLSEASDIVNRGQFAQLLVNASIYKGKVAKETNVALYGDVKKDHWAAAYIHTAINNGWMSGYLDGSFRPEKGITLQEAVKGVITLLGYTNQDFNGNILNGQMALYQSKGLDKNIKKTRTQYLTVKDCNNLFYNLLNATTKEGKVYAQILGYTVDAKGNIDYMSIINNDLEGPIIADDDWKSEIPFSLSKATIYLDDMKSSLKDIRDYDVIYYSEDLETIWAYDNKVTGTLEQVYPDSINPQSVRVAGKEYTFETSEASIEFSSLGSVKKGDIVTLLLGKNDAIASVISTYDYNTSITGIVVEKGTEMVEDENGILDSSEYVVIVNAAGNQYKEHYNDAMLTIDKGDLVRVTYTDGNASVTKLGSHEPGFDDYVFSADGSYLGSTPLASNVKILDINDSRYVNVYPSRLADVWISSGMVLYSEKNESGAITQLILDNVTGDTYDYGILTALTYPMNAMSNAYTYSYIINGKSGSVVGDIVSDFNTEIGAKGFLIINNELVKIKGLKNITVHSIKSTYVQDATNKYPLAEDYGVYIFKDGAYVPTTIEKISNLSKYKLSAYYDKEPAYGGRVRVIIAETK